MKLEDLPAPLCRWDVDEVTGCWLWRGFKNERGYGSIRYGPTKTRKTQIVHRVMYELLVGPIPAGLQLDHLCRVRHCMNPDHLEPVTARENMLRGFGPSAINAAKTHCHNGHPFDEINTLNWQGARRRGRICRACRRSYNRARRSRLRAMALAEKEG